VFWVTQRNFKDNEFGQEITLSPKRQNPSMQRSLKFFQWWDPQFHFECAVTRPKLNARQYCYGVGSNFITGAPPEFEDSLTLGLCLKPKFNDPKCVISKQGFT
jgi:hypothetical protein